MAENRKRLAFCTYTTELRIGAGAYTQALTKHTAKSLIILTETVLYPRFTVFGKINAYPEEKAATSLPERSQYSHQPSSTTNILWPLCVCVCDDDE